MSILRAQLFISLDGVVGAPEQWHFPYLDDAMTDAVDEHYRDSEALLLGRITYDIFASSWPKRSPDAELARRINSMPKLVATSRADLGGWGNSSALAGKLADAVGRAKAEARGPIITAGSVRLVRELLRLGLVDDLQLMIHPIVLGRGDQLFPDGTERMPLRLAASETFPSGVLNAHYLPIHDNERQQN